MTAADRLAAIRTHATDPSYGPVPGAEVAWLCDEVERLRGRVRLEVNISDRLAAMSADDEAERNEARRALGDLRAGICAARNPLAVLADPDVLAGMAGDLMQRGVLGCCVDCPTPHTRSDHEEQAREVAAAVVEWLTGGAQ